MGIGICLQKSKGKVLAMNRSKHFDAVDGERIVFEEEQDPSLYGDLLSGGANVEEAGHLVGNIEGAPGQGIGPKTGGRGRGLEVGRQNGEADAVVVGNVHPA